ncbi:MAG: DUF4954 family protein [Bacteroidales bacterium]|nr:DUF4954 family protein [Bacteroidales bacterium]
MNHRYRSLTPGEIEQLERAGNYADDWSAVRVADSFCPKCLRNNILEGYVTLGEQSTVVNSTLRNCSVGADADIRDVRLLSDYVLGDRVTLFNIGEMTGGGRPHALEVMNENGGRAIVPFAGMTIGDAYMWARYRGRKVFMQRLEEFTDKLTDESRVGDCCTVKNTTCIRNVTIQSTEADRTVVDSCITLIDGVVGYGCTLEHGVIAERFLLGEHVHLEFGLRLNDTVVGDNSTLARCEVGNSVIFPAHEQHHNNSFLIAGLIMGQSNIAAGGTIGSNHNSRTADNELAAGRGFWPGLCCSFKHSSRFASYCLLAKGDYPAELDIKLPFALVNNNVSKDQLEVMPAYWWMYNMYAMDRNSKKFAKRDKRVVKAQHIEFDNLAPDTAEEILGGMELLRQWMGKGGTVFAEGMEKSKRPTVVLKAAEGLKAYEEMLVFYAMKTLEGGESKVERGECREWVNIGGQLVAGPDMERLIADVESGVIGSWAQVHERMDALWQAYPAQRAAHAYGVLCRLAGVDALTDALWQHYRQRYADIQADIEKQKVASRRKDDENPFRNMTYWDSAERDAVLQ